MMGVRVARLWARLGSRLLGVLFTGSPQALVDDLGGYAERGLEHLVIGGDGYDLPGTLEHLERFAEEVMGKVDRG